MSNTKQCKASPLTQLNGGLAVKADTLIIHREGDELRICAYWKGRFVFERLDKVILGGSSVTISGFKAKIELKVV